MTFKLPNVPLLFAMAQCAVRHAALAYAAAEQRAPLPPREEGDEGTGECYDVLDDETPEKCAAHFDLSTKRVVDFNRPKYGKDFVATSTLKEHTHLFLPFAEWRFEGELWFDCFIQPSFQCESC